MRTISRPEPPAITRIACGATDRGREALAQAERDQHAGGVGPELDSGAGLFQLGGLLEHGDAQAGARQRQRRRQPRDAGAGDDDVTRGRQDLRAPIVDQAAADIGKAHSGGRAACESSLESNRYSVEQ